MLEESAQPHVSASPPLRMLIDFRHGVAAFATSGGVIRSPVISFNRYDQEQ